MFSQRPFSVTLLLWMVLSLSAWGAIRSFAALRWWDVLYEFNASLSPFYLLVTGVFWGIAGIVLLWSLWTGKAWSLSAMHGLVLLWLAQYWIERLFFQSPRANLPFAVVSSALLLAVTFAITTNRYIKNFFTKSEEHEQSNEHSASA
jgi:hypothetical protein